MTNSFICVICKRISEGYGNSPEPIISFDKGKCCDVCNATKVIPARIAGATNE